MKRPIEGVNFGGWLVLERWMTPSLFNGTDAQDEVSFMATLDADRKIEQHRKTFITEEDWQWLHGRGIELVRLPVGYWALRSQDGFKEATEHLDWAFYMAKKYKVSILLDIHALGGSQNGEMHSGAVGVVDWWRHRHESLDTITELAKRYSGNPALWGVEIVNEPKLRGHYFKLLWFYRKVYASLRKVLHPGVYTVFHDAFAPPLFAGALRRRRKYPVIMDSHFYLIFGRWLRKLTPEKYDKVRSLIYRSAISFARLFQPVIVGEWSAVLPQAMFNRTDQRKHLDMLGDTVARQRVMYKKSLAIIYWNYKTEGRGMYNYRSLVEDGIIPLEK